GRRAERRGSWGPWSFHLPDRTCRAGPRTPARAGCPQARAPVAARREAENTLITGSSAPTGRPGAGPETLPRRGRRSYGDGVAPGRCRGTPDPGRHHVHHPPLAERSLHPARPVRAAPPGRLVARRELPLRGPDLSARQPAAAPSAAAGGHQAATAGTLE